MYILPIRHRVWDDHRGEVIELPDIYGFQALDKSGAVVGEGESREDAITAALEKSEYFK
ncbi:MAG: hypothetical protein Q7R79_02065 [bacterium]|nr:hypothetical protein [bacterium]